MARNNSNPFTTVKTAGMLLPVDLLARIDAEDSSLKGLKPSDYHLGSGQRLNEAASRAWNECKNAWESFRKKFAELPASDAGTSLTREEWLLPLFNALGYGRLQTRKAIEIGDSEYAISHGWVDHVPIHLLSARYELDRRTPGVAGASKSSPYSMVQELLNRSSQYRWGFLTNGLKLIILRDNVSLARASNVEFDLEAMMDGGVTPDFKLLWLLCHQSRVEIQGDDGKPEDCWLEKWANEAESRGTRALNKLRDGVENSIKALGAGFLSTRGNGDLHQRLRDGTLPKEDYYRQLLRLVYRLLLLLVAEEKKSEDGHNLLHDADTPDDVRERYAKYYSVGRLRTLASERRGTSHTDLYESLKVLFLKLRDGYQPLGIPGLGSFLFSDDATPDLDVARLANHDLLDALRQLCFTEDTAGRRPVDFGNLGSEELGSVYESLLELHPQIDSEDGPFTLTTAAGSERKTTGSYYTPASLINCLLDSALDPVVHEAIDTPDRAAAEQALLNLKVCDPACGSGHFLIAAAERMAKHLARLRTDDDEPSTLAIQHAKRDIIGRCIYGVDVNPMAVELCKVSLWMEALEPGRPLSFLDHHIQCGNSLLGTTPALLEQGIPDNAFKPIEGDVKAVASDLKKQNKKERTDRQRGQSQFEFEPYIKLGNLPGEFTRLSSTSDDSVADVAEKERRYAELVSGADYQNARLLADTWCAVFVWQKDTSSEGKLCPTENDFRRIENNPHSILPHVKSEVRRLADQYQFFHWHLAFPDVFRLPVEGEAENEQTGWNAGFDVVLGNPPWDMQEVKDNEFFAVSYPAILSVKSAKDKKSVLETIERDDPALWQLYVEYVRKTHGQKHMMLNSNRYPLAGTGRLNLYRVFLETDHNITNRTGHVGVVVPSGFASDSFSQTHFTTLHGGGRIRSLFDFENRDGLFPGVHKSYKFCLLTIGGQRRGDAKTDFVFFARQVHELSNRERHVALGPTDLATLNPLTKTAPLFKSNRDQALTLILHAQNPIVADEDESGWRISPMLMFMMNASMKHHRSTDELESDGFAFSGHCMSSADEQWFPLYEGKMVTAFDHRASSIKFDPTNRVRRNQAVEITSEEHQDPNLFAIPVFWVEESQIVERCDGLPRWCPVVKDVTSATNIRTSLAAILPASALTDSVPYLRNSQTASLNACMIANLNAFSFDFCARQKVAGLHLRGHYLAQLPLISLERLSANCEWCRGMTAERFLVSRVLELTYTAWDLEAFALDCGYAGPPFRWDQERRFLLRCELDAAYFHLYLGPPAEWGTDSPQLREMFPTPRDAVDYIMETFPIVKRKDIARHGDYRTKLVILDLYDQMQQAIETGEPFQTSLDPPPGAPTAWLNAETSQHTAPDWPDGSDRPANWPDHIHPPKDHPRQQPAVAAPAVITKPSGPIDTDQVITAFAAVREGRSADFVAFCPETNRLFLDRAHELGVEASDKDINQALLNARKAGKLSDLKTTKSYRLPRTVEPWEFASEWAVRHLQRELLDETGRSIALDELLCNPDYAARFDQLAARIKPGFEPLAYRWAALGLRKKGKSKPDPEDIAIRLQDPFDINDAADRIPEVAGLYLIRSEKHALFAGHAIDLQSQLHRHREIDNDHLIPNWLIEKAGPPTTIAIAPILSADPNRLRTTRIAHIAEHRPWLNLLETGA